VVGSERGCACVYGRDVQRRRVREEGGSRILLKKEKKLFS
jgi:hypothetical protein